MLRKNVQPDEIDTAFNFLAELAYKLFLAKESQATLDTASYAGFLSDYKANFIISDSLITRIENGEYPLLRKRPDSVDFEHPYVYYYFAGKHIAAKQDNELIQCLVDQCYRKDYAFLLIFTVHHAQDAQVIEEILLHCMCCFDTVPAARLDQTETDFMASLFDEMPKSILSALPVEREREEERSELPPESAEEESPANLVLQDVEKALKIMDVLGQILKNRSGSFAKPRVIEVLD